MSLYYPRVTFCFFKSLFFKALSCDESIICSLNLQLNNALTFWLHYCMILEVKKVHATLCRGPTNYLIADVFSDVLCNMPSWIYTWHCYPGWNRFLLSQSRNRLEIKLDFFTRVKEKCRRQVICSFAWCKIIINDKAKNREKQIRKKWGKKES